MQHPAKKAVRRRKNRIVLWTALAVCLVLAAAFVLMLPVIRAQFPSQKTQIVVDSQVQRVFQVTEASLLESLTVTPENGESYTLRMQGGRLMLEDGDGMLDINDTYADELLSVATNIVGQGVVVEDAAEVEEHLSDMGLETPRASAVIRHTDGGQSILELGANVPNTTYAYCRWSGSPAIYMCDAGVIDALTLTRRQLLPVEQPQIYAGLLDEMVVENAYDRCRLSFTDGAYGRLEEPFSYPLSRDAASRLGILAENFRLGMLEGAVTDENRAAYGFDEPLCVIELAQSAGVASEVAASGELETRLVDQQSLRFTIGRPEGEYFYTCEYEGKCYLVSRFLTESFLQLKRADLLSRNPADVGDLALKRIWIQTEAGEADLQITRSERVLPNNELETDAEGNVLYDTAVALNGGESTQELLDEVVSRLDALTVSADAPADWSPSGSPRWTMILETETGLVRTVEAWKMDLFTDVIAVDGVKLHCVHSEAIDVLTQGLF